MNNAAGTWGLFNNFPPLKLRRWFGHSRLQCAKTILDDFFAGKKEKCCFEIFMLSCELWRENLCSKSLKMFLDILGSHKRAVFCIILLTFCSINSSHSNTKTENEIYVGVEKNGNGCLTCRIFLWKFMQIEIHSTGTRLLLNSIH